MSTLYVVSTPIGNLADLSGRAEETLRHVQRILAEDTRRTRLLADRSGSAAPLVSLHAHNERERVERILDWLAAGEDLALVSDAGTPLVSDPGSRVVEAVVAAGHRVVPVPGPSAVMAALVGSGLPCDRFTFPGFPDRKGEGRRFLLERVATSTETVVLFESPRRVTRLLDDLARVCGGERRAVIARELTKVHEEFLRGTLDELVSYYETEDPRGEVTVVVAPVKSDGAANHDLDAARTLARELLGTGLRPSAVARTVSDRLDLARNEAYRMVQDLDHETDRE